MRVRVSALFWRLSGDSASMSTPPVDEELAAEQAYLEHALESLEAMRQRAERLLHDLIAAGNPDLDYVAALSRRVCAAGGQPTASPLRAYRRGGRSHLAHRPAPRRGRTVRSRGRGLAGARVGALLPGERQGRSRAGPAPPDHGGPPRGRRRGRRPVRWRRRGDGRHSPPRRGRTARRARAGPHGRDARHRRHHPGRAGRDHPCPARPPAHRAGRTGHRQDGRRPPSCRFPALQPPDLEPRRRARPGPEPCLLAVHRTGPALPRRGGRRADNDR